MTSKQLISAEHYTVAALCFILIGLPLLAQTSPESSSSINPPKYTLTWEPHKIGCDDKYTNGQEVKTQFTTQAYVLITFTSDLGKLALVTVISNENKAGRIEINPDRIHVFKISQKGPVEIHRISAAEIAKSLEKRQRIAAGLSGFAAGSSQTTATATSSDGTETTITIPNTQATHDAIAQAHTNITAAQSTGQKAIDGELKRNTLDPGEKADGRLYFPSQKAGEDVVVQIDIGDTRYEFPYHLPKL